MDENRPRKIGILCPENEWRKTKLELEQSGYRYQFAGSNEDDQDPPKNSQTGLRYLEFVLQA